MPKSILSLFVVVLFATAVLAQDKPVLSGNGNPEYPYTPDVVVLYDQTTQAGTNSLTSQNFETAYDAYDNQGADDFVVPSPGWIVNLIEVLGVYYNGTGPANSVNVWFYTNSGTLPSATVVANYNNVVPTGGLATGSFVIPIPNTNLSPGTYWVSIQANMDFAVGGQYGWTEHMPFNSPSAWQNPGGGFGTPCSTWGARVATCGVVGTAGYDDFAFRLSGSLTPVELTSFTASSSQGVVELNWLTATETNNRGFEVQRSNGNEFQTIAFVNGHGTTSESQAYVYSDRTVNAGTYSYRLKQVDFDGTFEYSKTIEVVVLPGSFNLEQNYPNPFNPSTMIAFNLSVDSKVSLKVFNVLGQEVANVLQANLVAGRHQINFDASSLNTGVYMYRIEAAGIDGTNFVDVKKMILTK